MLVRAPRIYYLRRARGMIHRLGPMTTPVRSGRGRPGRHIAARVHARLVSPPAAPAAGSLQRSLAAPRGRRLAPAAAGDVTISFSTNVASATRRLVGVDLLLDGRAVTATTSCLPPATGSTSAATRSWVGLLQRIAVGGYPWLDRGFESSVPGCTSSAHPQRGVTDR